MVFEVEKVRVFILIEFSYTLSDIMIKHELEEILLVFVEVTFEYRSSVGTDSFFAGDRCLHEGDVGKHIIKVSFFGVDHAF